MPPDIHHYAALSRTKQPKVGKCVTFPWYGAGFRGTVSRVNDDTRGHRAETRLLKIGISKREFAERAGLDRGTLNRALANDEKVGDRTWSRIEGALDRLEDEIGMAESGQTVTSTIEFRGARITMAGSPADVAEAIRQVLSDS